MATCVNKSHPEFLELVQKSGINPDILAAKIGVWMEKNGVDSFPDLEQLNLDNIKIRKDIDELFKINPDLLTEVYRVLGYTTKESLDEYIGDLLEQIRDFPFEYDERGGILNQSVFDKLVETKNKAFDEYYYNKKYERQYEKAILQYSRYLNTIFPDSKVKGINYHGTEYQQKFEKFDSKLAGTQTKEGLQTPGFWFTYSRDFAEDFGNNVISVLLNIKNPYYASGKLEGTGPYINVFPDQVESVNKAIKEGYDSAFVDILEGASDEGSAIGKTELVVFEPEQIHILGGKKDIEGFKEFVDNNIYLQKDELGAIPLKGNERLYKHYNLLNNDGKIKTLPNDNKTNSLVKTLNLSNRYSFKLRNTMGGWKILIFPKDTLFQRNDTVFGNPVDYALNEKIINKQIQKLQSKFASIGVNLPVVTDDTIEESAAVKIIDDKLHIVINPYKMKEDSIFHEFGHILVDLIEDQDFIDKGIAQLKGTELYNKIEKLYWDKTEKQIGRETLVTAIGLEARNIFKESEQVNGWKFWFNRFLDRVAAFVNRILGKSPVENKESEQSVVKALAKELTSDNFTFKLNNNLRIYENQQRNEKEQRFLKGVQDFLVAKKNEVADTMRRYKGISINTPFGQRLHETFDELELINEANKDNLVTTLTVLTDTLKYDLENLTALEKRAEKLVTDYLDKGVVLADLDSKQYGYFAGTMRNLHLFLQNYIAIEELGGIKPEDITDANELDAARLKKISEHLLESQKEMLPRVVELEATFRRLMPLNTEFILQYSTNPKIQGMIREFVRDWDGVDMDESKLQLYLDALMDSNNVIAANMAKLHRVYAGRGIIEAKALKRKYWDARNKLSQNSKDLGNMLTDSNGRLHKKYDMTKYYENRNAYLEGTTQYSKKWYEKRHKFDMENTQFVEQFRNAEDLQAAIDEYFSNKKKELGEIAYKEWYDLQYDAEHGQWRITSEVREFKDEYLNPAYVKIRQDADLSNLYDVVQELLRYSTEGYSGSPQERGYLPSILNKTSGHKYADKEETFEMVDAEGNVLYELPFKYIGLFQAQKEIYYRKQYEDEERDHYEKDVIETLVKKGVIKEGEFKNIAEIIAKNQEIRKENRKRHGEAVSRDLDRVIPAFIESAMDYKYKKEIEDSLLLGLAELRYHKVKASHKNLIPKKKQTRGANGEYLESTRPGVTSNAYRHAEAFMRMVFYEKFLDPHAGDAMIGKVRDYASVLGMGFNFFAGVKNISYGLYMNIAETSGGRFYTPTDLAAANKMYFSAVTSYAADTTKKDGSTSSFANGLIHLFDVIESYDEIMELQDAALSKEFAYKLFNDAAFFMQYSGEHMMQNMTLLSMLHGYRFVNGKPMSFAEYSDHKLLTLNIKDLDNIERSKELINEKNELRKNLKTEFEKYVRLVDMFEMEDGYAKAKDEYKEQFTDDVLTLFREKVRGVNHKLHGVYNKQDKGTVENTMVGQMAMQFRRWMRPGWNKRFGTRGGIFSAEEFWNERRDENDMGTYEALWKFVKTPFRKNSTVNWSSEEQRTAYTAAQAILKDYLRMIVNTNVYWNTLTEEQKRKAISAITELGLLGIVTALSMLLVGFRDDDDKLKHNKFYNFILYQLSASTTELATYTPIYGWFNETGKILQNPTAVYGLGINMWRFTKAALMYPFIAEEDRYFKGGVNHDKLKVTAYAGRFIPGVNMYLRWANLDNQTKAYRTQ